MKNKKGAVHVSSRALPVIGSSMTLRVIEVTGSDGKTRTPEEHNKWVYEKQP